MLDACCHQRQVLLCSQPGYFLYCTSQKDLHDISQQCISKTYLFNLHAFAFSSLGALCLMLHTSVSQSQVWSFVGRWWGVAKAANATPWSGKENNASPCQISSGADWLQSMFHPDIFHCKLAL